MNKTTSTPKNRTTEKAPVKNDERKDIFEKLKKVFDVYAPPFIVLSKSDTDYDLISNKPIIYMGIKRDSMYFASLRVQKSYITLHLMHVYTHTDNIAKLGADLLKLKKGKACFHIKKLDENLLKQIKEAAADGIKCYKKAGIV